MAPGDLPPSYEDNPTQEEKLQLAVEAIQKDSSRSQRAVARFYDVPESTLRLRLKGGKTRKQAHEHQQRLTNSQEQVLQEWIRVRGLRGVPLSLSVLGSYVSHIVGQDVGTSWPRRYLVRHPELQTKMTTSLEACRAKALNETSVNAYFDLLQSVIRGYNVKVENIWNMDEKGIQLGIGRRFSALIDRDQKTVHSVESGSRDLVTIIEAVCADGKALRPSVIFQGIRRDLRWGEDNPAEARCVFQSWLTTSNLSLAFFLL